MDKGTTANAKELLHERKQLFMDAVGKKKKPARIPMLSHVWAWKILDAGYQLSEALNDYDKMTNAVCIHQERYQWDSYMDLGTRNPKRVTDALGKNLYIIDDETGNMNYIDQAVMQHEDYDKLINEGLFPFYFETAVVRKFEYTDRKTAITNIGKAAKEYLAFQQYGKNIKNKMIQEYGVPSIAVGKPTLPTEMLFCALRGIKGFSVDVRRDPERVKAALTIINEGTYRQFKEMLDNFQDDDTCLFPVRITSLAHTVLNPRQFEQIYWPFYSQYLNDLAEKGLGAMLFIEGSMKHLVDFYQDIPAGKSVILLEQDDPFEMKKLLPNLTIAGGFPQTLLAKGTKEQCIDYVKKIEDELAYDGSYIFAFDKMISYPDDAKPENMMAISEYLHR